jgi:23S rRNA pseudouridine2605 synthase
MQRNSRPGKGAPKNSDSRPKRSSSTGSGRPSSTGRSFSRSTGKDERPRRSSDNGGDGESRPRRAFGTSERSESRPPRSYGSSEGREGTPRRTYGKSNEGERPARRPFDKSGDGERPARRSFDKSGDGERPARRPFDKSGDGERPARRSFDKSGDGERPARRSFDKSGDGERPARRSFDNSSEGERPARRSFDKSGDGERPARRSFDRSNEGERPARRSSDRSADGERPARRAYDKSNEGDRPARRSYDKGSDSDRPRRSYDKGGDYKRSDRKPAAKNYPGSKPGPPSPDGSMRLNKYLSNSGICSRREADELIVAGAVMVNGITVTELGTKILPSDKVQYGSDTVRREKHVYVLLNKPKGYITTTDDPYDRNTVMALVADAGKERIYPVGRLDRNTSGLLLFTNDGEMAKKLTHPSHKVRKVYHVELDKALTKTDLLKIGDGIELEDGMAMVDAISYDESGKSKKEIGVELHSGKNRIVRRIFEALGYDVVKLDRMVFAGLTKKDLPRGRWRFLTEKEVNFLQMIK